MNNILIITQTVWLEMVRRKDIYIILALQAFCTFMLTSISAFGSEAPSSYIMDIGLMLAFLLSIGLAIILGSRQLPAEIRSGTIFSILTKPISRMEFLIGKWLGLWTGMLATNLLFYLIVSGVTLTRNFSFEPTVLIQVFCLHAMLLAIIIAVSLFFTMFFTQGAGGAATAIFVILCYFILPRIPHLLIYEQGWRAGALWGIYHIAPHLELFDMRARVLHNWGALDIGTFLGTMAYGLIITAAFIGFSWALFRRKYFKRGEQL
ncbi:MAG: ABC transporter permease subunit [Pontiellaceae bacterium]|nr:ABC transporter permease subunit [Pontiellaceae bacterium]MBN2785264.1 ABC transporter permease subunit [Pontiellaceae bacterium]